jgi:hypothetical protein
VITGPKAGLSRTCVFLSPAPSRLFPVAEKQTRAKCAILRKQMTSPGERVIPGADKFCADELRIKERKIGKKTSGDPGFQV